MKQSKIEKAIEELEDEVAVLNLAIAKLKQQQGKAPMRGPRVVKPAAAKEA